jgi:CTP synthase
VDFGNVIESRDVPTIYQIPLSFREQGFDSRVVARLGLPDTVEPDLSAWHEIVRRITRPAGRVRIAVVGKYTDFIDSYKSVQESLIHGGIAHDTGVDISWMSSDRFTDHETARALLGEFDGLLVPGGFGVRGIEGMVEAIRAARELRIPFFGICLGTQRRGPVDEPLVGIRARLRASRDFTDGIAGGRDRHGRHHATRRVPVRAPARIARRRCLWRQRGQ